MVPSVGFNVKISNQLYNNPLSCTFLFRALAKIEFSFFTVPRPDEVEFNNATAGQETRDFIEGEDEQASKKFIKALPTTLELTRQFKVPGTRYFFPFSQKTRLKRLLVQ